MLVKLKGQGRTPRRRRKPVKVNENTKKNLEQEIQGYKIEAQRRRR